MRMETFPRAFRSYVPRTHCINSLVYGVILLNFLGEIAIVRGRKSGKWSLPKGHGRLRETPIEASIREMREETGVDLTGIPLDDEIRFNSGTYFVFIINERIALLPEDNEEIMETMWVHILNIGYLRTNKDLTSFYKTINLKAILEKVYARKISSDEEIKEI